MGIKSTIVSARARLLFLSPSAYSSFSVRRLEWITAGIIAASVSSCAVQTFLTSVVNHYFPFGAGQSNTIPFNLCMKVRNGNGSQSCSST